MQKGRRIFIVLIIILIMIFILFGVLKIHIRILEKMYPKNYSNFVTMYAKEYQVDENLIYAIIKAESNFNPEAVSGKSAYGLMQIVEETAIDVARRIEPNLTAEEVMDNIFDVDFNIQLGTKYVSMLLEQYDGNIPLALTAYNAGIGTVNNWIEKGVLQSDGSDIENIPYKETNQYVRKILRDYDIYQNL